MKLRDIPSVHKILLEDFTSNPAPVIDLMAAQGCSPFQILVATILSARTKDETTSKVIKEKLFPKVKKASDFDLYSLEEVEQMIFPVGFFHQKAKALKQLPRVLEERFAGKIPETIDELCELPGVGRKTANLVVAVAFKKPAICVDVHVHRINNRLGLVATSTPQETEFKLREILPVKYWRSWNACFVSFGQRRCRPINPHCDDCPIRKYCDYGKSQKTGADRGEQ